MELTKKPFQMSFAGNPMRYLLSGTSSSGTLSVIKIGFSALDTTPGHSIDVTFLGDERTFTLRSDPATKDDLPIADDNWTVLGWAQHCFAYLMNDVHLLQHYSMVCEEDESNDGGKIILTAKTASPSYDWSAGANNITGFTVTTLTAGIAPVPDSVEGVLMQVWKNGSEKLGEDFKPVDSSGNVRFEVQEYIYASLLQVSPPRFHLTFQDLVEYFDDYFLKYLTVFCDRIAGVFSPRTYGDPDNIYCYALAGGLNREDLVANNDSQIDYFDLADVKKKFLTWSPPSKLTDKFETHSLFFAIQEPTWSTFQLKANLYSENTSSSENMTTQLPVALWSVFEFPGGYDQLGLDQFLNGDVITWELFLVDENDTIISDVHRFELDEKYYENTRYFRFRNSWGTYDSLRCIGVFETIIEHDREKVAFISDETETSFNSPGAYSIIKEVQSFKANTGWLAKEYLNYLRDFMLSSDIYEVVDGRLLKCLLTSKKTSLSKDANYNYSLAFEYERAYDDFFFQMLD